MKVTIKALHHPRHQLFERFYETLLKNRFEHFTFINDLRMFHAIDQGGHDVVSLQGNFGKGKDVFIKEVANSEHAAISGALNKFRRYIKQYQLLNCSSKLRSDEKFC